ncbi:MAG: MarR family transcriptional regulator [Desulfobacteraceae bacterium]|nr:MarR family transcriptional regulator [Desulfobacteraceae bacterium]MBC2757921.1 MarR family transcriptional regulator [Desulfobacteraceae bacterium]
MKKKNTDQSLSNEVLIALRRIVQAIDLHSKSLVKNYGITGPQLVILQELWKHKELSVGELAKAVSLGQATVTGVLNRLEKREYITRSRSELDKRRVHVKATDACKELLDEAPSPLQETFLNQFEGLQNWEQHLILTALQRMVAMMDARALEAAPILATGPVDNFYQQDE